MKVLFAVSGWGLGHATRDLGLVKALVSRGDRVTVLSTGRAIRLLRSELGDSCAYIDFPDIPVPISRQAFWFYVKMTLAMPAVFNTFRREHNFVRWLNRRLHFDSIISDSRYGVFLREVPSYYISHSLRQIVPGRIVPIEMLVERVQKALLSGAHKILVPDQEVDGLAGDLCHGMYFSWPQVEYLGILSSVRREEVAQDVDYFISVSGPEPQRTIFEEIVMAQAHSLPGRVVVTLGRPEVPPSVQNDGGVTVHSYMDREQQGEMMNRARMIISRSGYTTLMELAELGKKALIVPTVGQSEQEYLGAFHERTGTLHCVLQKHLDLARDVVIAEHYTGIPLSHPTEESVGRFVRLVDEGRRTKDDR